MSDIIPHARCRTMPSGHPGAFSRQLNNLADKKLFYPQKKKGISPSPPYVMFQEDKT